MDRRGRAAVARRSQGSTAPCSVGGDGGTPATREIEMMVPRVRGNSKVSEQGFFGALENSRRRGRAVYLPPTPVPVPPVPFLEPSVFFLKCVLSLRFFSWRFALGAANTKTLMKELISAPVYIARTYDIKRAKKHLKI